MDIQNFTASILVDKNPEEVFNAINNVRSWWSGEINGHTDKPGAEFSYQVPGAHFFKQKITEFIPGKKIVWYVAEESLNYVKHKSEWKGTNIIFEINRKRNKTEVLFTHIGLLPEFECFTACSDAWGILIKDNLQKLITAGKAQPGPW
jgi:hypothetical protein